MNLSRIQSRPELYFCMTLVLFITACSCDDANSQSKMDPSDPRVIVPMYKVCMAAEDHALDSCIFERSDFRWSYKSRIAQARLCSARESNRTMRSYLAPGIILQAYEDMKSAIESNRTGDRERVALKMLLSQAYMRHGWVGKAHSQLQNLLSDEKLSISQRANVITLLGETFYIFGDLHSALREFEKVADDNSAISESCKLEYPGSEMRSLCQRAKSMAALRESCKLEYPGSKMRSFCRRARSMAALRKASILARSGRTEEARVAFSSEKWSDYREISWQGRLESKIRRFQDKKTKKVLEESRIPMRTPERSAVWMTHESMTSGFSY